MKRKVILGMLSPIMVLSIASISVSCNFSNNEKNEEERLPIKTTINFDISDYSKYYVGERIEIWADIIFNQDVSKYSIKWSCDSDVEIFQNNNNINFIPTKSGNYKLTIEVIDENNKVIGSKSLNLIVIEKEISYDVQLSYDSSVDYKVEDTINIYSNLVPQNSNFFYEWIVNSQIISSGINLTSLNYKFENDGVHYINLNIYSNENKTKLITSSQLSLDVKNNAPKPKTPTDEDLKLNRQILSAKLWNTERKTKREMVNDLNNYGVLNSLTLTSKIYYLNLFEYLGFENARFELIEQSDYVYVYRMTGISTKNMEKWGKQLKFPSFLENGNGIPICAGDKLEVQLKYVKKSNANPNIFDENKITIGGTTLSSSNPIFKNVNNMDYETNMFYSTEFDGFCKVLKNDQIVSDGNEPNNRVFVSYVYDAQYNKGMGVFGDNNALKYI